MRISVCSWTVLNFLLQVFYSGLLPILDLKAVTVIFANVEDILLTNTVSKLDTHIYYLTENYADILELSGR